MVLDIALKLGVEMATTIFFAPPSRIAQDVIGDLVKQGYEYAVTLIHYNHNMGVGETNTATNNNQEYSSSDMGVGETNTATSNNQEYSDMRVDGN